MHFLQNFSLCSQEEVAPFFAAIISTRLSPKHLFLSVRADVVTPAASGDLCADGSMSLTRRQSWDLWDSQQLNVIDNLENFIIIFFKFQV